MRISDWSSDVCSSDLAVSVVLDFVGGIDAAKHRDLLRLAVRAVDGQGQLHARLEAARHAGDIEGLLAGELQRMAAGALNELQWQHAHAHQVRAVDASDGLEDYRIPVDQTTAPRGPVAQSAGANPPSAP